MKRVESIGGKSGQPQMERAGGWRRQRFGNEPPPRCAALVPRSAEPIGHTDEETQLVKTEPRAPCCFVPRRHEGWISCPHARRSRGPVQVLVPVGGDDQRPARRHLEGGDQCAHIDNLTALAQRWRARIPVRPEPALFLFLAAASCVLNPAT